MAKALMVQGTGSHVGKSLIVTALCRIFHQRGYRVAPFKAQNMALNSFVTEEGGEMGRAQVAQAEAAGVAPSVDMNPILIKPQSDSGAQVIIQGKVVGNYSAVEYHHYKREALKAVKESYQRLAKEYELIVIEGAGSPAEVNLKKNDIVNMRVAAMARAPVMLVGDIDRGGVFASLIGTLDLLTASEKARVKGLIINKFRGDFTLLKPGITFLKKRTGVKVLGVIPFLKDIFIADEDSLSLEQRKDNGQGDAVDIAVLRLPHISNFTDFDPLEREEGVTLRYVESTFRLGNPDVLIIPGSKNTIEDLYYLQSQGFVSEIMRLRGTGSTLVGICGGFQMLGKTIKDPYGVETTRGKIEGLGLLDIDTQFAREKTTFQVVAKEMGSQGEEKLSGSLKGYEIHLGDTKRTTERSLFKIIKRSGRKCAVYDGAISKDGKVWGTYIHGIFDNDPLRRRFLGKIRGGGHQACQEITAALEYDAFKEEQYNKLADLVRTHLTMDAIYTMVGIGRCAKQ